MDRPLPLPHVDPARWRALVAEFRALHPGDAARIERGWRVVASRSLYATGEAGTYRVPASEPGRYYLTRELSCTCPDAALRGVRCKHSWAVTLFVAAVADEAARLVDRLNAALRAGDIDADTAMRRLNAYYARYATRPEPEPDPPTPPAGATRAATAPPSEPAAPLPLRPASTIDPTERWAITPAGEAYLAGYERGLAGRPPAWLREPRWLPAHHAGYLDGRRARQARSA